MADLVFGVIAFDKILHDAAALKEVDRLAIGEGVGDGGDAAVGVDGQEPGLFLRVLGNFNLVHFVGEAGGVSK